jgi:hypothetical protein
MNGVKYLETAISNVENSRARNLQKEIGPSALGGCARQVWYQLQDTPKQQETESLATFMGTAIHKEIAEGLKIQDVFGDELLIEQAIERDGLKGNVDLFVKSTGEVIDWKSSKKSTFNSKRWPWPSEKNIWQVQVYGWMLTGMGYDVKTVTLVGIPRDGLLAETVEHSMPYDESIALKALDWLRGVQEASEAPAPEKRAALWCSKYCDYFTPDGSVCAGL